jgi:hypothetical protein
MTAARYSAFDGALASGSVIPQLHHSVGTTHATTFARLFLRAQVNGDLAVGSSIFVIDSLRLLSGGG